MIPVLIVPILNGPEHLDCLFASIDHPIGRIVVIDNGDLFDPADFHLTQASTFALIQPGHNLGVAASWNLGMKATPQADWWLIVNHDVEFAPGDLDKIDASIGDGSSLPYTAGFAAFAITASILERVGYFDENFHPAYDEDLDYIRRCDFAGVSYHQVEVSLSHVGSATINADARYRELNGRTHGANDDYYRLKWGGPKEGGETFTTPFSAGGHVGDWRLDPRRLRQQTWR